MKTLKCQQICAQAVVLWMLTVKFCLAAPVVPGMGTMPSSVDLNDSMSREASGTAWLPESSPMYGKMFMQPNGDMLMVHGAVMPRYVNVGSKRGDHRFDAPNWLMGMYSHPLGSNAQLGLRGMFSLDPITEGGFGYPLLFQTGESWHRQPLHDRQHPHDLVDELSATYSRLLGGGNSASLYLGYPGEPALGPPTYMHRLIAYDLPDAPIGHHWQDATHITFGVATAGLNLGHKFKLEASDFTGREPDENRYSFDRPRFDSYSGRLSYNPNADNSFQISNGFVKNPEGDGANVHRTTASWIFNKSLGMDANFTTTFVWGQNDLSDEGRSSSYLGEIDYQNGPNTLFTRIENIQKSGRELVLPAPANYAQLYDLGEYMVGGVHDLVHGRGIDTGLGAVVTLNTKPSSLDAFYGPGSPVSFEIFFRLRPSRMKMAMNMDSSGGESSDNKPSEQGGMPEMKGMNAPAAPPVPPAPTPIPAPSLPQTVPSVPSAPAAGNDQTGSPSNAAAPTPPAAITAADAAIFPNPPHVGSKNILTVTVTGSDGKPFSGAAVKASVAMTTMDMGTSHPAFHDNGDGTYTSRIAFSMPGPWRVTLRVTPPQGGAPLVKRLVYQVAQ